MSNVTRITSDANVQPDPKRGIDKPLDKLLWEDFSILIIDDEHFFSSETLKLAGELYEVAAQQKQFVKPGPVSENSDIIIRIAERQQRIIKVIHEDIKKMPPQTFDEYFDRLLEKIATEDDIFSAKCSVYSNYLESLARDIDSDKGFDGSLQEVSRQASVFAEKLDQLSGPQIKEAIKKSQRVSLDIFTDDLHSDTILHDVIDDMMNKA